MRFWFARTPRDAVHAIRRKATSVGTPYMLSGYKATPVGMPYMLSGYKATPVGMPYMASDAKPQM